MQFGLHELFVGQLQLVLCDEGGGEVARQGVFHHFFVFVAAEQDADTGVFVWFFYISVQGFEVEVQLAEVFGRKLADFEFEGYQGAESAVVEQQIQVKILIAYLQAVLFAHKNEIAAQFQDERLGVLQQGVLQIPLAVGLRQP